MTVRWPSDDCQMTVRWLSDDCLMTFWWLSDDSLRIAKWLPDDCPMTVQWLRWISNDNKTSSTALKMDCGKVRTFWEAHKNLLNLLHALYIYLVNVQSMRKIPSIFVCFSESLTICIVKSAPDWMPLLHYYLLGVTDDRPAYQLKPAKLLKKICLIRMSNHKSRLVLLHTILVLEAPTPGLWLQR